MWLRALLLIREITGRRGPGGDCEQAHPCGPLYFLGAAFIGRSSYIWQCNLVGAVRDLNVISKSHAQEKSCREAQ